MRGASPPLTRTRELEAFAQLGTDLDPTTQRQLDRGARMVELLKQGQAQPLGVEQQVMMIKGASEGMLDGIAVSLVSVYEKEFLAFMSAEYPEVGKELVEKKILGDDGEKKFKEAVKRFTESFKTKHKA
jgi:F-type H+-transporting ATPase subunit alpha